MMNFENKSVFRIKGKLRDKLLDVMDIKDVSRIEFEVLKKLNNWGISNSKCSYRIIINKFSWKVNVCSKKDDDKKRILNVVEDLKCKEKEVIGVMESFRSFNNSRYHNFNNDKKYKVYLLDVDGNYNVNNRKMVNDIGKNKYVNQFFSEVKKLDDDVELFRELYNWKKFEVNGIKY